MTVVSASTVPVNVPVGTTPLILDLTKVLEVPELQRPRPMFSDEVTAMTNNWNSHVQMLGQTQIEDLDEPDRLRFLAVKHLLGLNGSKAPWDSKPYKDAFHRNGGVSKLMRPVFDIKRVNERRHHLAPPDQDILTILEQTQRPS